ncbi:nucleotide-binding protein [Blastomonas sp.]|uniref:nucleotide-binding protein n=1 Tax=Blastomonas sp. TaxID=1909299 RepID=UPI00262F820C|nr:nucleotide-binding protein [Blastomonas sp.]MDM7957756.1 nucleotide-binding protein [Blastomonas sp.]
MARKTTTTRPQKPEPALLAKPREQVRAQLLSRVEIGVELIERTIDSFAALDELKSDYAKWNDYNTEFLRRAFTSTEYADEYSYYASVGGVYSHEPAFSQKVEDAKEWVIQKRDKLISLVERLDLIDEQISSSDGNSTMPPRPLIGKTVSSNKVFLVHGQDEEAKAVVARFISGCGLEPIILHEQASGGRTIIEKFENEADVGFAVVLMTADDVGGRRHGDELASDELRLRARQNVVLELGYFVGRLGRSRVAALKRGDIELPSDIAGVVWTAIDAADGWKLALARELKNAGYEFELDKAFGM